MEERVKSIVSTIKPDFKRISDVIEDDMILNYFLCDLKKEITKNNINFADLRSIILCDYYLKFNKKDKKKIIQLLKKENLDPLLDYCTNGLIKKEKRRYNKKSGVSSPFLKYCNNMNVEILSTSYIGLLENNEIKSLIKQSHDIKDLKAIIFIDVLMPMLDKTNLDRIINSELGPEQKAIEFSRQYQTHKEIIHEKDKINSYIDKIDYYNNILEAVFHNQIFQEDISFLFDIKKIISDPDNVQHPIYDENKDIVDEYNLYVQDLSNLFEEKVKHSMKIIKKNMFDLEKKYNLNDNSKKGYFGSFARKKRFESAKKELSEYHNQFNKIKELIQT